MAKKSKKASGLMKAKGKVEKVNSDNLVDGRYSIQDLVDIELLRNIFEKFTQSTGFTIGFLDHPNLSILIATGWRDICTKFHRVCPTTVKNCMKSNKQLLEQLKEPGQLVIEECENGLVDCATPIIIKGKHIASLATGQLLLKQPDIDRFKRQAHMCEFNEKKYLEALKEIPVVSGEKLMSITSFLGEIATVISNIVYTNLALKEEAALLDKEIKERKQAEEALRESEKLFRTLVETTPIGIWQDDVNQKTVYINPTMLNLLEFDNPKELYDISWKSLFTTESHETIACENKKRLEGKSSSYEVEIIGKRGGKRYVTVYGAPLLSPNGTLQGTIATFLDITERKRAEKALRESEKKYHSLFEESKDVVYFSTPEGKFLDINPAGVELFGYPSKKDLLQVNITQDLYVNPDDREKFQKILSEQGYVKDYEMVFKRKDGEHVVVTSTTTLVQDEVGRIIAYRGIMKDITERKRLEQQLIQAQKMEAVGQLAGGIAHDFNNILTAIIGFGTLLKMETDKDALLQSYATQILTSAERAANLTLSLLAFSRKQIISPKLVNLNEIILGIKDLLSRLIGEDTELSTVLTDKDVTVMADSSQLEQVLMNLATNARDAMPAGGYLIIKTERIELDEEFIKTHGYGRLGSYAVISVNDTGVGIDEETKKRIFEPFFTTKEVGKGTGLGLSIVYGIVKQHDGYINIYCEPEKGTAFKIYLPLMKAMIEEAKEVSLHTIKRGTETVLVAEDDVQVRKLIKEVLAGFGYTVLEAEDGEDALRVFSANKDEIQLVIFDVIMPKKSGKEIYDEIKKTRSDIKAIFTSGYDANIIHKRGIIEEGLNFISKPILPDELLRTVREVLDK